MWSALLVILFILFVATVSWLSFYLGQTKTENPKASAVIGFLLAFLPPLALIYLIFLSLKEETSTV
jgi:F0F1-type ATP synthase assembly protein I